MSQHQHVGLRPPATRRGRNGNLASTLVPERVSAGVAGLLTGRPAVAQRNMRPSWQRGVILAGGAILLVVLYGLFVTGQYLYLANACLLAAIGAIGLNILTGNAGLVSIGNAGLMGFAAYAVVIVGDNLPFPVAVLLGGAVAAVAGLLIGIPSLRLRGLYLVFSTLAFHYLATFALLQWDNHTDAISGHNIGAAAIGPINIVTDRQWYVFLAIVLAVVMAVAYGVLRGRPGRAWDAIRSNEASAAIMGVDVVGSKLSAFVFSSFVIGICGSITAYFVHNVSNTYFTLDLAVSAVAMILIGGLGSVGGAVGGAIVITALPTATSRIGGAILGSSNNFLQQHLPAIDSGVYGLLVLAFMFFEPAGLAGLARRVERLLVWLVRRLMPQREARGAEDGVSA